MNFEALYDDRMIGKLVGFSAGWVRTQRHYRKYGKPHILDIDPIWVGEKPRYRPEDVAAWFEKIRSQQPQLAPSPT